MSGEVEGYPWLTKESNRDAADHYCGSPLSLEPDAEITENQKKGF